MRRPVLVAAAGLLVLAAPFVTAAKPFPALNANACERVGGVYSVDKSSRPPTKTCVAPIGEAGSEIRPGGAPGYTVQVSWTAGAAFWVFRAGERNTAAVGGAIAVTGCWLDGSPVDLSDPNCSPH